MLNFYSTSRSAQYFEDPLTFKPERWSREESYELTPFSYLPFGFGPRSCYGKFGPRTTVGRLCPPPGRCAQFPKHNTIPSTSSPSLKNRYKSRLLVKVTCLLFLSITCTGRRLAELEIHLLLAQVSLFPVV